MSVAPRAGAWIETYKSAPDTGVDWSLPARERGLKRYLTSEMTPNEIVAPRAGAWIETSSVTRL